MEKPEFPVAIKFSDGDIWELSSINEVACNLEWFDSDDPEEQAIVTDRKNRKVRIKVIALKIIVFELE